ncbi:MAG: ABC transporter permease [Bifidobacteriaceae bacterium]|jgi:peptide/nickel transport system permease protein|nr:ABC transporter permease [Bifidobacteriaceae bacterium]
MSAAITVFKRVGLALGTLVASTMVVFGAMRLLPGNYADLILGPFASDAAKAEATARLGLDQSVAVQYWRWLTALARGDFGTSFVSGTPIAEELALRLPVTIAIACGAGLAAVVLGTGLGLISAVHARGGAGGAGGRLLSALGISIPEFVLGGVVVYAVSSLGIGSLVGAFAAPGQDWQAFALSMILPTAVLSVFCVSATARTTRDAVLSVLVEPHVTASVSRGETPWFIIRHHVMRNASIPVLTQTATIVAGMLGGAVIVESVFDVPGVGSYLVQALGRRDYGVVQAGVVLAAAVFLASGLIADLAALAIDPRLRSSGRGSRR